MNKGICFQKRQTLFPEGEEIFYLSGSRMPYFHSNTLSIAAYGELAWRSGAKQSLFHPYWSFTVVLEGEGFFQSRNKTVQTVLPGDIYIARPGVDYTVTVKKDNFQRKRTILLNCSPLLTLLCNSGALADKDVIRPKDPARFHQFMEQIRHLVIAGSSHLHEDLAALGYAFVHELITQTAPGDVKEGFEFLARELEQNLDQNISLEEIAEKYHTSTRTLNRLFHEHFQCSPHEFLYQERMKNAARLLQDDTLPIKAIAEACGYKNLSFFARSFKLFHGRNPREYRSNMVITDKTLKKRSGSEKDTKNPSPKTGRRKEGKKGPFTL